MTLDRDDGENERRSMNGILDDDHMYRHE